MRTPITKDRLKTHFTYSWWKYAVGVLACLLVWNLFFSVTRTKAPEDKKMELYVYGNVYEAPLDALLETMRQNEFPDQAEFDCYVMTPDTTSGIQSFTVRVGTGDGDLLLVTRDVYESFAQQGVFQDLDSLEGVRAALASQGVTIDPARDYWKGKDGQSRFYGIPTARLAVLNAYIVPDGNEYYLCVRVDNGNEDVTRRVLISLIENWTSGENAMTVTEALNP